MGLFWGVRSLKRGLGQNELIRVGSDPIGLGPYRKRARGHRKSQVDDPMRTHGEHSTYIPRKEASRGASFGPV